MFRTGESVSVDVVGSGDEAVAVANVPRPVQVFVVRRDCRPRIERVEIEKVERPDIEVVSDSSDRFDRGPGSRILDGVDHFADPRSRTYTTYSSSVSGVSPRLAQMTYWAVTSGLVVQESYRPPVKFHSGVPLDRSTAVSWPPYPRAKIVDSVTDSESRLNFPSWSVSHSIVPSGCTARSCFETHVER